MADTPPTRQRGVVGLFKAIFGDWKFTGAGFLAAVMFAWFIELIYGLSAANTVFLGVQTFCLLWFASAAAFFSGTIAGFLFGVPKVWTGVEAFTATDQSSGRDLRSTRYRINTNLEDISDWFTKIILGLGLVHAKEVVGFIDQVGNVVGDAIGTQGAKVISISAMIYGFVSGFLIVYIWTRTTLKAEFERFEAARMPPP